MWCFMCVILATSFVDSSSIDPFSSGEPPFVQKRNGELEPWKNPNLPDTIEPILYNLSVVPHIYHNRTLFQGNVSIEINVLNRTKTIIVHKKKELTITYRGVRIPNGPEINVKSHTEYEKNDYYVMETEDFLTIGRFILTFAFEGNMTLVTDSNIKESGLYSIPYVNEEGTESWLAVTDFGPSKSRYIFPNFDEPRFKARFRIQLKHWNSYTVLSNMPIERKKTHDDGTASYTIFKLSPKMSSYLIGFAITVFPSKNKTVNGKQYRVWTASKLLGKADIILNATTAILNYLQQELNMTYPLEKLDQLAVPTELVHDQKENWGMVTYKESKLIFDVKRKGDIEKQEALLLMARSLALNYFGNLVTCRHWTHNWLKDGLATFYGVRATTDFEPTMFNKEFLFGWEIKELMEHDATLLTSALISDLFSTNQAQLKGAAVLRMAENFIGADAFKLGIKDYLTKHAYGVVLTDDLLIALQLRAPQFNMKLIMTNWIEMTGLPVINVKLLSGSTIKATQKQFLTELDAVPDETYKWYVPLTYRSKGNIQHVVWMNKTDVSFPISLRSSTDWIEFNCDRTGYYRVNYDANLWGRISKQLSENHKVFSELTRSAMLSDAVALARAEQLGFDVFLNLTKYASKERDLTPWLHMFDGFEEILSIANDSLLRPFRSYLLNLTKNLMDKLQVKDTGSYIEKQLRPNIMMIACYSGHNGCIDNTTRLFKAWIQNETRNPVPRNIRYEVYRIGITFSNVESEWNTSFERFRRIKQGDRSRAPLLRALTCSRNTTILERLLDLTIDSNFMEEHDAVAFVMHIAYSRTTERVVWNWLKRKYAAVAEALGPEIAGNYFYFATMYFNTRSHYQEVLDFYKIHPNVSEVYMYKNETKKSIDENIRWMDRNLGAITTWLNRNAALK